MPRAWYSLSNTAMNTSNDLLSFVTAASRRARIVSVLVGGMGTTSTAGEIQVVRNTGGTTPGGAQTALLQSTDQPAATGAVTVYTTWAAQPSTSGTPIRIPFNANGGVVKVAMNVELRNAEQAGIRPVVGTFNVTLTAEVEYDF